LLFALAALMWSVYTVLMRRWHAAPLAVVAVVQVGGLLFLPWYLSTQSPHLAQLDGRAVVAQALYLGLIVSVLSVLSFNLAVRILGAKAALFTALMPVIGVSLSVLLLSEPVTPALLGGTAMIVLGLVLALRKRI
jgi:drug/metabolite transporter (DMT)-like permease